MKRILPGILIFSCLLVSCYKPYDAGIDAEEKILVVEGMITNEVASYSIRLTYSTPFYSGNAVEPVTSAHVYVTDNSGNSFHFTESEDGYYNSDSLQFTGIPGKTYTLYIETPDAENYMSDPQLLIPAYQPDSIYAVVDIQTTLSRFNEMITTKRGGNILVDMKSTSDTLPRFRFTSKLVQEYYYVIQGYGTDFEFHCWQTEIVKPDINLGHMQYSSNSYSLDKHAIYFVSDKIFIEGWEYLLGPRLPDLSYLALPTYHRQYYPLMHRILYLNQYSLNDETYLYYESMDALLKSESKLFDPIAVQLRGNIKCTTNRDIKIFGFFEASSVSRTSYIIGFRNPINDIYPIKKTPYILPPEPYGCLINKVPPFWVSYN